MPNTKDRIMSAIAKGKEKAALVVLALSFLHSLYATYLKPESETAAKAGYDATSHALYEHSLALVDRLHTLNSRVDLLEGELARLRGNPLETVVKTPRVLTKTKSLPESKGLKSTVEILESVEKETQVLRHTASIAVEDSLVVRLPTKPWRTQQQEAQP